MSSTLDIDLGSRSTGLFATLEIQCFPTRSVQCVLSGDCDRAFSMLSGDPSRDMLFFCAWALVPDFTCFTLHRNSSAFPPRRTRWRRLGFLSVTLSTFRRHDTSPLLSSTLSVPVSSCVCRASTTLVVSFVLVSGPFFVVTLCVMSRVPASAGDAAGVPEDDDPPCGTGVRCSVCVVQYKVRFSLEATTQDGTQRSCFSVLLYFLGLCSHVVPMPRPTRG